MKPRTDKKPRSLRAVSKSVRNGGKKVYSPPRIKHVEPLPEINEYISCHT